MDDSIDSGSFSVRGYLPLIRKDYITHMHGFAVYVKERLPIVRDLSLSNSADSYLCFRLALFHSVFYFFFLYRSPSSSICTIFDSISSDIDEVLSINPSGNAVETLTSILRTGSPILVELIDLVNSVIIFFISNDLTHRVEFSTRIPDCDFHSAALLDLFLLTPVVVQQWLSLYWDILMLLSQFPLTFQ